MIPAEELKRSRDDNPYIADEPRAKTKEQRYHGITKPKEEMFWEPDANAATVARVENNSIIAVDKILVAANSVAQ